jgi:hypothetical protein
LKEGIEFSRSDVALGSAANQNGGPTSEVLDIPFMTPGSCRVVQIVILVRIFLHNEEESSPESQRVDCFYADATRVQKL